MRRTVSIRRHRGQTVYLRLRNRSWLRRVFELHGGVEARIEYNARKAGVGYSDVYKDGVGWVEDNPDAAEYHAVLVNGRNVVGGDPAKTLPLFAIPTGAGEVWGRIEVRLSNQGLLVRIAELKLTVAGQLLYHEVDGKLNVVKQAPNLPIPAEAGWMQSSDLPLPGKPGGDPGDEE